MIIGLLVLVGIVLFQVGDLGVGQAQLPQGAPPRRRQPGAESADIPNFYAEGVDFSVVPTERRLITNGIVLSLDPQIGRSAAATC